MTPTERALLYASTALRATVDAKLEKFRKRTQMVFQRASLAAGGWLTSDVLHHGGKIVMFLYRFEGTEAAEYTINIEYLDLASGRWCEYYLYSTDLGGLTEWSTQHGPHAVSGPLRFKVSATVDSTISITALYA
jgi:hypothetical protein